MIKKLTALLLVTVLVLVCFTACSNGEDNKSSDVAVSSDASGTHATAMGVGKTSFIFTTVAADGNTFRFTVMTDKKTVSEALLEYTLITGEQTNDGYILKTVYGQSCNPEKKEVWKFYINDELSETTPDKTPVTNGYEYKFKIEAE